MKLGFFRRLAAGNIRRSSRFFVPRILAETGLLGCFYIVFTLSQDQRLTQIRGGAYLVSFMQFGAFVIGLLSLILMLYTNSFLMKQRKREFGLYNILGMEKRHVGRVMLHENLICSLISLISGLVLGMLFYKLCSLLICRLLQSEIIVGFYFITAGTLIPAALIFIVLDLLTYISNRISLARMKPVELLHSKSAGEREPRVKWLMLILGVITLGLGYYLAVSVQNPLKALLFFFVAVILVIIGTYFLFVSGSIFVLKALKKNKNYYYRKKHFATVSGLLYRMKQNAVGLASIAILATGVLVMISTTVSLYSGMQQTLEEKYPQQVYLTANYETADGTMVGLPAEAITDIVKEAAAKQELQIKEAFFQQYLENTFLQDGSSLLTRNDVNGIWDLDYLVTVDFITADTYNKFSSKTLELKQNEVAVCRISSGIGFEGISDEYELYGQTYTVAEMLDFFPISSALISATAQYGFVVADEAVLEHLYQEQKQGFEYYSEYSNRLAVSFTDSERYNEVGELLQVDIFDGLRNYVSTAEDSNGSYSAYIDSLYDARDNIVGMYGTFLFLGILLGLVCLFATALIIYYKQISEGYEDRERFQIMKKVGMSDAEIKKSIRTQILLAFFLPLLVAACHICFAAPMLEKLLLLLLLPSTVLFIKCMIITYVAFALVYIMIYSLTARTYYRIIH